MQAVTENSAEKNAGKNIGQTAEQNPVSVLSVSFAPPLITDLERDFLMERSKVKISKKTEPRSAFSKKIFKWQNAVAVAAILAVGALHFAYQMSVIKIERSQIAEVPAKVQTVSAPPADVTKPVEFEATKVDAVLPPKPAPVVKQRQAEPAPAKPQLKKKDTKDAVESKAERLRRAEKILTGI